METHSEYITRLGSSTIVYDKIGRKSGTFPITTEAQQEFDNYQIMMHKRIMGLL